MESCSIVWSPVKQKRIEEMEKIKIKSTKKIENLCLPPKTEEIKIVQFGEKMREIHDHK